VTSFHDASAGNTLEDVVLFRHLRENGVLQSRATVMIGSDALPQLVEAELAPFSGDEHVRVGSVKIMLHEGSGDVYPPLDELSERVWQAHHHGFQIAVHAVEEGPICAALEAIGTALQRQPRADHRHRIEHCALCPPPFIEKLLETGTAVVTQPGFLHFYGEKYCSEIAPELHEWLYRAKSLLAAGVPVAGSSDCPIAPLSPLLGLQAAMTRKTQEGSVLNPQEQLTLNDALTLFTSAGAWLSFEESYKGKIMPGMLADVVVLDGDLTKTPAEEIGRLGVNLTIVGGKVSSF
jgi:predicted amidohydrolase YtcJ